MKRMLEYEGLFEEALCRIKSERDPRSSRPDYVDLKWGEVVSKKLFEFLDEDIINYYGISKLANEITIACLCFIIEDLMKSYGYQIQKIDVKNPEGLARARLYILDKKTRELLLFKEIENGWLYKHEEDEPQPVREIMEKCGACSCKYIYFLHDNAYLQIVNHKKDLDDPGKGFNFYSIKWFFETYFSEEEYSCFNEMLRAYIDKVRNCIGYDIIRTLTPGSQVNFLKITENEILKYAYDYLLNKKIQQYTLEPSEFDKIKHNFLHLKTYSGLLGSKDYAESFVTAEGLFDSMKKAQAIDLTIIGMGYCKAIEQLLFEMICLHRNEGRKIQKDYSKKELDPVVELNDTNIKNQNIDFTIGSMAKFLKDNLNILRNDLNWRTKKYIREAVFQYKELRNQYFHKSNIHEWQKIETIRNATFELAFLLLGAKTLSEEDKLELGFPTKVYSDYYKLCEYVNYHHADLFYLDFGEGKELMFYGHYDRFSKMTEGHNEYTGVYFKRFGDDGKIYKFSEDDLPSKITLGKFVFGYADTIKINTVKVKTVFENGKFVGPSIAEEEKMSY